MDPIQPAPIVETYESLSSLLELTLLSPSLTDDELDSATRAAVDAGVAAVVVRPCDVATVSRWLAGSGVKVASVAGYPYGISTTAAKLYEGRDLLRLGVKELDFVVNPAMMISRSFQQVETEALQIVQSAHEADAVLTVVCNNRLIANDMKIIATKIAKRVEADAIAIQHSEADLAIMKPLLKDLLRLKRSDAVMTLDEALAARDAGYHRITSPNAGSILQAWKDRLADQAKQTEQQQTS